MGGVLKGSEPTNVRLVGIVRPGDAVWHCVEDTALLLAVSWRREVRRLCCAVQIAAASRNILPSPRPLGVLPSVCL